MIGRNELLDAFERYVAEKRVDERLASRLRRASETEQRVLLRLIDATNPSANTLRQFVRLAEEIALRDETEVSAVFGADDIGAALDESTSKKDRQRLVRAALERRRYPLMSGLYQELEALRRTVSEKWGLKLEFPQDLEGDEISIRLSFKSAEELLKHSASFEDFSKSADLEKIFALLKGGFSEGD